jgi:hypothetical protein
MILVDLICFNYSVTELMDKDEEESVWEKRVKDRKLSQKKTRDLNRK